MPATIPNGLTFLQAIETNPEAFAGEVTTHDGTKFSLDAEGRSRETGRFTLRPEHYSLYSRGLTRMVWCGTIFMSSGCPELLFFLMAELQRIASHY